MPRVASNHRKSAAIHVLSRAQIVRALERMSARTGTDRYAAGKALAVTAEKCPARVYPHFAAVAGLLAADARITRWNAMRIVAALATVDSEGKVDAVLDRYLASIQGGNMISAANAIAGAADIARAKPALTGRIVPAILSVEHAKYETPACRNVAIGHALQGLRKLWPLIGGISEVREFIGRQQGNLRPAVARRARQMQELIRG